MIAVKLEIECRLKGCQHESRGYHVWKAKSSWNAKSCDEIKDEIETKSFANDPYSYAIITKHDYFAEWKTVACIPREISWYVYLFMKK